MQTFSFKNMHLNKSSVKWRPFCLSLNVLMLLLSFAYNIIWKLDFRINNVTDHFCLWPQLGSIVIYDVSAHILSV